MLSELFLVILAIIAVFVIYSFVKNVTMIVINAILGLAILLIFNQLDLFGMGDIPIGWVSVLVCALGGLFGAVLLILFNVAGVPIS
jgi:hypothetical protein